jgi:polysaccharide biosynthesis/export protein ExoF
MSLSMNRFMAASPVVLLLAVAGILLPCADAKSQSLNNRSSTEITPEIGGKNASGETRAVERSGPGPKVGQESDAITMSAVERVRLIALEYAALNGEFNLDADHTLSLPGVGRISAGGMSPSVLEEELAKRISRYARLDVKVSLEISRFRPYFITGMISESGSNEWKPGLNILKAIALARGTVRLPTAVDDPVASLTVQQSRTELQFSLALLARLQAERDGTKEVENQENLNSVISKMPAPLQPRLREFIARQDGILEEQRKLTLGQISSLEQQRQTAERELEAATLQEKAHRDRLEIAKTLLGDIEALKDKKLIDNSRYLSQRSDFTDSQIKLAEAQGLTERVRSRVDAVTLQIETARRQQRVALNDRIDALQREVAQLEVRLLPATRGGAGTPNSKLSYSIARETPKGIVTLDANVFTPILPGDVIVVSGEEPDAGEGAANPGATANNADMTSAIGRIQRAIETSSAAQMSPSRSSRSTSTR